MDITKLQAPRIEEAKILLDQKKYSEAASILKYLVAKNPANGEAFFYLGRALCEIGETDAAIASYIKCTKFGEKNFQGGAYYNLGKIFLDSNLPYEALSAYLSCTQELPEFLYGYLALCGVYKELQRYSDAINILKEALRIFPDNVEIYKEIFFIHYYLKNYLSAAVVGEKVLELNPNDPDFTPIALKHLKDSI